MAGPWEKYGGAPQGQVVSLPPDPMQQAEAARAEARLRMEQERLAMAQRAADLAAANANRPNLPVGWQMGPNGVAQRVPGLPANAETTTPKISAKERADALAGYKSSEALRRYVTDLEQKFAKGPGATKGVAGLQDYLPTTANRQFDAAGNAARGIVGQALGFTGGQLNTATEANMAVGPFLPQADDRDDVIADKIRRLSELADQAEQRSIAILGGRPDQNGQVQPIEQQAAPQAVRQAAESAPPAVNGRDYSAMVGGPQYDVAAGQYRREFDPVGAETLSAFIRAGKPYEAAAAYAQSHGFTPPEPRSYAEAVKFARQHGGATNVEANRLIPTTAGQRFAASPLGAGIAAATTAGTAGLSDVVGRSLAGPAWDANRQAMSLTNPGADLAGNVVGGVGAMLGAGNLIYSGLARGAKGGLGRNSLAWAGRNPAKAGVIGDAAYGATYGATQNPNDPLAGALMGGGAGVAGGALGAGIARGTGAALGGVRDPAVRRLREAGIPLTVGGVLGGGFKKAEDALTSVFGPGNMVSRRQLEGREAFNRAAFRDGGDIIGEPVNAVGQAGIEALDAAKSRAYAGALDPVQLNLNTPQAVSGIQGAISAARRIPNADSASDIAYGALENYIGNAAPSGLMDGRDFQQAYRGLSQTARSSSSRVFGRDIGEALGQGQDALVGALESQNPGAYQGFLRANRANRHLSVLTDAVNAAKNQVDDGNPLFTPAQLGTASTNNTKHFSGKVAAASGNRPFNQLINDGQQVLGSRLNESGTIPRALITAGVAGGGGMFGGTTGGMDGAATGAIAPLALLTLLGTRRGQQLLTSALTDRSARSLTAGRYLRQNPQIGGDILAAAGIPLLAGQ